MTSIPDILLTIDHRPFELPKGSWKYYQEWNDALFLHWKIPFEDLRKCVPAGLTIDTFDGDCYVSLVAFNMQKIRPRYLPSISFLSDFHEINLRTYVVHENKQGVYFLNIEAEKFLSVFIAKQLSGLPYEKSNIKCSGNHYLSVNTKKHFKLDVNFETGEALQSKTSLEDWLTERYCLYLDEKNGLFRYDIHHKQWELNKVNIDTLHLKYQIGNIDLSASLLDMVHYSNGIKVLAWSRQKVS